MTTLEFTDANGNIIRTIGNPSSGGEGDVYDVEGNPDLVVKIYNDKKRNPDKQDEYNELITKIQAMCDICDDTIMQRAGWPQQIVYLNGDPMGFTMNKIKYCNTFHQLADTIDRKEKFADNNWKYSLYVAYNLACAVNALHQKGVVIGDINESNFLIGNRTVAEKNGVFDFKDNGIVYCIDCDSYQVEYNGKFYLCRVGKREYTSPELSIIMKQEQKKYHEIGVRTKNHDNFGLAVLIFQLLMLGRHPYMGIGTPGYVTEAINGGYFVFGKNAGRNQVYPPIPSEMYSTIYYSLNDEVRALFEQAFSHDTSVKRPTAEEWIKVLKGQIAELLQCSVDKSHFYDKDGECIWCKISNEYGLSLWGSKINANTSIASAFHVPNISYQNTQTIQKTTPQNTIQNTTQTQQNTQVANVANLNTPTQPICTGYANYSYNGIYFAAGILYLYPDYLMFKGHKFNFQHHTKIIPLNEIIEIKEKGVLISYSIEIVNIDGTYTFNVNPVDPWIANLYKLIDVNDVPFVTTIDYNGINAKTIMWFHELNWVVEFQRWVTELSKGNFSVILDILKWILKVMIYRLILRPILIVLFSIVIIYTLKPNASDEVLSNASNLTLIMLIIFAFIPEKILKQPLRRILFLCGLAILLVIQLLIN